MSISLATDNVTLKAQLESYIHRGWPVLPLWGTTSSGKCRCGKPDCKSAGKHPMSTLVPHGVKDATTDKNVLARWLEVISVSNWGIRCGMQMDDGRYLVVLDRDPRNGGNETLEQVISRVGPLPDTVAAESGGGGGHYLFGSPEPLAGSTAGPGLDIIGADKYIVVSPSVHTTGGSYNWVLGAGPMDLPVADAPSWLVDGAQVDAGRKRPIPDGETARATLLGEIFSLAGKIGVQFDNGIFGVECPWAELHSDGRGKGQDTSTVILPPAGGSKFGGFSCKHGHCVTKTWEDVVKSFDASVIKAAEVKYPRRPVAVSKFVESAAPVAAPIGLKGDEYLQDVKKRVNYKETKTGLKPINDIVNIVTILLYDPRWKGILQFDEFAQVLRITRECPWHPDDKPKVSNEVWGDSDTALLDLWFRRFWGLDARHETLIHAAYVVGRKNATNPLTDWLDSLKWDGVKRLDQWLVRYLGAADNHVSNLMGRKWMLSAVARAYKPGSKADHMLVIEGAQGRGKSTALRILGGEWFSDTPLDLGTKDSYVGVKGRWIIEIPELASFGKTAADKIKAFLSSPDDSYRPPYGKELVKVKRTCVFAGSVNHATYLNDETGARRFWPVACGAIDTESLRADRDQLWAETVQIYKEWVARGSKDAECLWWPAFNERGLLEIEQSARDNGDAWEGVVGSWLRSAAAKSIVERMGVVTSPEVATLALGMDIAHVTKNEVHRITCIMARLKWIKSRQRGTGAIRQWGAQPPPDWEWRTT